MMSGHDLLTDGESEAGAATGPGFVNTVEAFGEMRDVLFRDSLSIV